MPVPRPLIVRHRPPFVCAQCDRPLTAAKVCWRCDQPEMAWTEGDLRHVVICTRLGVWCGYVEVPADHVWHGLALDDPAPVVGDVPLYDLSLTEALEDIGVLPTTLALMGGEGKMRRLASSLAAQVRVFGGLSFAGWKWFHGEPARYYLGFDAVHHGYTMDPLRMDPHLTELMKPMFDEHTKVLTVEQIELECRRLASSIRNAWVGR